MNNDSKIDFKELLSDHIDALQELGNIGSGHAANALADLLNRRIDMSLPRFTKLATDEISTVKWGKNESKPEDIFAVVIVRPEGELKFYTLIVFDNKTLNMLLRVIREQEDDVDLTNLSAFDRSIITEVGNILGLHFLTSINNFLGTTEGIPSPPTLIVEQSETILASLAAHYSEDFTHLLLIECDIYAMDTTMSPLVLLAPEPSSIEKTLEKMFEI